MKKTLYAWLAVALWVVFVVIAVIAPAGGTVQVVTALLWTAFVCVWMAGAASAKALLSGGRLRQTVIMSLAGRVFGVSSPYGRWLIRLLIIVFLVTTGSLASMVIYLVTMVLAQVLKLAFSDPVLICRA